MGRRDHTTYEEGRGTMPKNKTHSGASKRFKKTGTGKLRRMQVGRKSGAAFASAPTTGSRKKHRRNQGMVELEKADVKRAKKLLGL
jgi:large subunit ribosomal protein L35